MFCLGCGTQLPEDAQFCMKCGRSLAATPQTVTSPQPTKSWRATTWVLLAILGLVIWWSAYEIAQHTGRTPTVSSYISQIVPIPHTQVIADTALSVRALGYSYYKFIVPPGSIHVSVDGHFVATGGIGNDIEVYILNDDAFANFQNHHGTLTYYNSGKVTQNTIKAVLPGAGTYYLVLNNNFSLITPKAVQVSATLHYTD